MKKLKIIIACVFALILSMFSCFGVTGTKSYAAVYNLDSASFSTELSTVLGEFCSFNKRVAGSENEKQAAEYIYSHLSQTSLTAKNKAGVASGIQKFQFQSKYTEVFEESQNIIFEYKAAEATEKKVVLACHYDSLMKFDANNQSYVALENDALNLSAGSVSVMLMLAKYLPLYGFKYNIEFVFLGAEENNFAGSEFYLSGISDEEAKNILCVINIDKVTLGTNLYYYVDEIETKFSKYLNSVIADSKLETKKIDLVHLCKSTLVDSDLGLGYSHIAISSSNAKFMKRGITTINLFAGNYSEGLVAGISEYGGVGNITYTENDTIAYVKTTYGVNEISNNLFRVFRTVEALLQDSQFEAKALESQGKTHLFYSIFANEKLAIYLTAMAFIAILIVAVALYYKLTIKSYYSNVENEFLSSVVKISDTIDTSGKDQNVPKYVSQIIANDIKKDKTIKPEKENKDKNRK